MHLVQLLLPTHDNSGKPFPRSKFARVRSTLTRRFGGVTIYSRAPAEGLSAQADGVTRDDIVVFEVMTEQIAAPWWRSYRARLEETFAQDEIVVRASEIVLL